MQITLTNDFHRTRYSIRPRKIIEGRWRGYYGISRQTMLRCRRALCGMSDCVCGGEFGERGSSTPIRVTNEEYNLDYIVDLPGAE